MTQLPHWDTAVSKTGDFSKLEAEEEVELKRPSHFAPTLDVEEGVTTYRARVLISPRAPSLPTNRRKRGEKVGRLPSRRSPPPPSPVHVGVRPFLSRSPLRSSPSRDSRFSRNNTRTFGFSRFSPTSETTVAGAVNLIPQLERAPSTTFATGKKRVSVTPRTTSAMLSFPDPRGPVGIKFAAAQPRK